MEWKKILDGHYEISIRGDIRRVKGGCGARFGKILRQQNKEGYRCVALSVGGWAKRYYVHRLVAEAFIGPCPFGHLVNHKDSVRSNNHAFNLEYVTPKRNSEYAGAVGNVVQGEKHRCSKVTVEQVQELRRLASQGVRNRTLSRQFGLASSTVCSIVYGKTWKRVSLDGGTVVPKKIYSPRAKLSEDQVKKIRELYAQGTKQVELCRRFGLTPGTMSELVRGLIWKL